MAKHLWCKIFHRKYWTQVDRITKRIGYTKIYVCTKCNETHYEYTYLGGYNHG